MTQNTSSAVMQQRIDNLSPEDRAKLKAGFSLALKDIAADLVRKIDKEVDK